MAEYKRCGLCGIKARHVASHVMRDHLPYDRTQAELQAALIAERNARLAK